MVFIYINSNYYIFYYLYKQYKIRKYILYIVIKFIKLNKMENQNDNMKGIYEVEKIINSKIYRNKKYYLIKWLCYPINECTWEPKSSLKNLNNMIDAFESEYPYSIDKDMYNIYCKELQKE